MMQNKYGIMSIEVDKPGFQFPHTARKYGFMDPVETMQTNPCECNSLPNGVSNGIGIAVGFGLVAGTIWGISKLLKR